MMHTTPTASLTIDTPLGTLTAAASSAGVTHVHFGPLDGDADLPAAALADDAAGEHLASLRDQLGAYFAGALRAFDVPLAPAGTSFQHGVWAELRAIPFGETRTYAQIAAAIGKPGASRAVGRANGANPIAIVVPCHRVIATGGKLCGYAAGADRKAFLLDLEGTSATLCPRSRAAERRVVGSGQSASTALLLT